MLWTLFLRRAESVPIKVLALRRDNFSGDIQLSVEGLPSGVTFTETKIEANKNSATLILAASESAPGWSGPIQVIGKTKLGDHEIKREARGGSLLWNVGDRDNEPIEARLTSEFVLAVSGIEPTPVSVRPAEDKAWEAPAGGKAQVPLRLTRHGDFNGAVQLKPYGLAALDSMKEFEVDGKATNATLEIDLAQHKLSPGDHILHLQAQTQGKYRNVSVEEEKAAQDAARQAEQAATEAAAVAKKAAEALEAAKKPDTPAETKVAAEKAASEASANAKQAEAKKEAAAKRAKEMAERAKPRDVTVTLYSMPIRLKVTEPPKTAAK
jgi:hypothetical protein